MFWNFWQNQERMTAVCALLFPELPRSFMRIKFLLFCFQEGHCKVKQTHYKLGMPMDLGRKMGLCSALLPLKRFMEGAEGAEVKALS